MKKSAKIVIIGGLVLFVHFKLLEIEKNETGQESAEQIAKEALEVINGEPHSELGETSEEKTEMHSEEGSLPNNAQRNYLRSQNIKLKEIEL